MNKNKINIEGTNIEITEAIREYVYQKSERLFKHSDFIDSLEVHLGSTKDPKRGKPQWSAQGQIEIYGPRIVQTAKEDNLYKAINTLSHKLDRQLRIKSRKRKANQTKLNKNLDIPAIIPKTA